MPAIAALALLLGGCALSADPVRADPPLARPAVAAAAPATATPQTGESLRETFGDWGISCVPVPGAQVCALAQELRRREDNGLVVLMEVKPEQGSAAAVGLTLPFGLQLDAGVDLSIDGRPIARRRAFAACLPQGCLVPLVFDAAAVNALRQGNVLSVSGLTIGGGKAEFALSLRGFAAAYAKMENLRRGSVPR